MAVFLVYNQTSQLIEKYFLGEADVVPYVVGRSLTVREFRGSSASSILWSDRMTLETWNSFRTFHARPIDVGYCFRRIWEGGHSAQSQHYAGTSFDAGQRMTAAGRQQLYNDAVRFGQWSYVEPKNLTPTWVHFDNRFFPPACAAGGYPLVRSTSRGNYVLILQDALNALGFTGSGLDGYFGSGTVGAVKRYQQFAGLAPDGIVGCNTWRSLTSQAVGIGRTSTVVQP